MKAYRIAANRGLSSLTQVDQASRLLGPNDVRVRMEASALNFRDIMIADGQYGLPDDLAVTPGSDGAGVVTETGADVRRLKVGDRVLPAFWPDWIEGPISPFKTKRSFGANDQGTLAEELVSTESSFAIAPATLSSTQSASLPCAGVTAWNALFEAGGVKPGASVLLLGTGGVSVWALQLAKAAGLRAIITSSSEEKLRRASELGAAETINYRQTPEWSNAVREITNGEGVDLVVEVGGAATIDQSLSSVRQGGTVVVIGARAGSNPGFQPSRLIGTAARLQGMMVGSRTMLDQLVSFVDRNQIKPAIDQVFPFEEAAEAFRFFKAADHFGKVAIDHGR